MSRSKRKITQGQQEALEVLEEELGEKELAAALEIFNRGSVAELTWRQAKRAIRMLDGVSRSGKSLLKSTPKTKKGNRREYVYFISNNRGHVKIGLSVNPEKRLAALQTSNPDKLTLLGKRIGSRKSERKLHKMFASLNVSGEWFTMHPSISREINPESKVISGTITGPQFRYLKHLVPKVSLEFYRSARLSEGIGDNVTEGQLSKRQASNLITRLVNKT